MLDTDVYVDLAKDAETHDVRARRLGAAVVGHDPLVEVVEV